VAATLKLSHHEEQSQQISVRFDLKRGSLWGFLKRVAQATTTTIAGSLVQFLTQQFRHLSGAWPTWLQRN